MNVVNNAIVGIYAPDGTLVQISGTQGPTDSNGNYMDTDTSNNMVRDTLRRTPISESSSYDSNGFLNWNYDVLNSQGTQATRSRYTAIVQSIVVNTSFGQSGIAECTSACAVTVVQKLTLPDGSSYSFQYDCDPSRPYQSTVCNGQSGSGAHTGELTLVTLPNGGQLSYGYTLFTDSYGNKHSWLSSRNGAGGGTWSYTPTVYSSCSSTQVGWKQGVNVTRPDGTSEVTTYTWNNGLWPTTINTYAAGGVATVNNTYDFSNGCQLVGCHGAAYIRLINSTTTVPAPGGGNLTKQTAYGYDSPQTANINAVQEWGYYPGTSPSFPATPDRATYMAAATQPSIGLQ